MGRKSLSLITNLVLRIRNRHLFALDLAVLLLTPGLALYLRMGSAASAAAVAPSLVLLTLVFLAVKLAFLYALDLYRRYWRFASVDELARIALAVSASLIVEFGLFLALQKGALIATDFPASILLTEALFAFIAVGGSRFSIRFAYRLSYRSFPSRERIPVLIVGAGEAGALIAAEMQSNAELGMWPAVFVDDDPEKHGLKIRSVTVEGGTEDIPVLARKYALEQAIIALPSADGGAIRRVLAVCSRAALTTRTIPGISELIGGTVRVSQLRPVNIEDLLRREPVRVQENEIAQTIRGKRVLVTGAGGSIGSELCRQILGFGPASLVLLDHSENAVYEIGLELDAAVGRLDLGSELVRVIGDIRDTGHVKRIFERNFPEIVFHAAAHKHVPLLEANPCEAVCNNVEGTLNVIDACERFDVERLVMLSTDKAVNPVNVMGATKRISELLVRDSASRRGRPFVSVRFGNVLGSRGSVVPLFQEQIEHGGPITVTHPEVERYFMSIPEAAQLVLQAGALARQGEVYVLDMGAPIRIADLAEDLIRLSGLEPGHDIQIEYTGLREGEKLREHLFLPGENPAPTRHGKILVTSVADGPRAEQDVRSRAEKLIEMASSGAEEEVIREIGRLVPGFRKPSFGAKEDGPRTGLTEERTPVTEPTPQE